MSDCLNRNWACWGMILWAGLGACSTGQAQGLGQSIDRWQDWSKWTNRGVRAGAAIPASGSPQGSLAWDFGARGVSTRTGVQLREIAANSPASVAGLRVGDTVVTVGGTQVGLVGSRLFDLEEEVIKRADANGLVSLVIFSRISSRLENVDVQLTPLRTELTGVVTGLDPYRLPADSLITVQIVNLTRPHYVVRNGSVTLRPTSNLASLPFSIAFDPAYVYPEDEYALRAQVSSGGNLIYHSERNVRVLNQGNSNNNVQLRMVTANTNWDPPGVGPTATGTYTNSDAINRQIQALYQRYLGREPYYIERAALMMDPRIDERLRTLPLDLMATQEFYDAVGNNDAAWINRIFQELAGRRPQSNELQNWQRRFAELRFSRATLLAQLQSQIPR